MAKSRFPFGLVITLAVLAGGGYFGYRYWTQSKVVPVKYITAKVERGTVTMSITATGDLQPVRTVEVSSQISGQVLEVLVDFNDKVKEGQVLARIDPATYRSRLRQAEAELTNSRASYQLVKANYGRSVDLRAKNLISQQDLDQAEAQLAQAAAQLDIREASVENAKVDLSRCTIYAPIDGIVLNRQTEAGKTVAASLNAPTLFTLVDDLRLMQINAAVAEADIGAVREGQDVVFTVDAFPERKFSGTVAQIRNAPTVEQSVVVYATIINVANEDLRLKPGMTANVEIIVAAQENVLVVPNAALRLRVPSGVNVLPAANENGPGNPAPGGAPAPSGEADRDTVRELMAEAGFQRGGGPPSPEVLAKMKELAAARGLTLPERTGGQPGGRASGGTSGEGNNRRRPDSGTSGTPTARTVYVLKGDATNPQIQAMKARIGITDGSKSEVLRGLEEGDLIVTTIIGGTSAADAAQPASNPFGGRSRF